MKKTLKYLGWSVLGIVVIGLVAGFLAHEALPIGTGGDAADALARKMEAAIDKAAWDSTRFVSWKFRTGTAYIWDKDANAVVVEWGDNKVLLNTTNRSGKVFVSGVEISDQTVRTELLAKAWSQFANDSFWMCAPMKTFDPGTSRKIVTQEDGTEALLVHYNSGGVTPGDSYLWELAVDGKPIAWRMWVNIIPVGGLRFSWEDWKGGAGQPQIAQQHEGALFSVPILDLKFPEYTDADNPLRELY